MFNVTVAIYGVFKLKSVPKWILCSVNIRNGLSKYFMCLCCHTCKIVCNIFLFETSQLHIALNNQLKKEESIEIFFYAFVSINSFSIVQRFLPPFFPHKTSHLAEPSRSSRTIRKHPPGERYQFPTIRSANIAHYTAIKTCEYAEC